MIMDINPHANNHAMYTLPEEKRKYFETPGLKLFHGLNSVKVSIQDLCNLTTPYQL